MNGGVQAVRTFVWEAYEDDRAPWLHRGLFVAGIGTSLFGLGRYAMIRHLRYLSPACAKGRADETLFGLDLQLCRGIPLLKDLSSSLWTLGGVAGVLFFGGLFLKYRDVFFLPGRVIRYRDVSACEEINAAVANYASAYLKNPRFTRPPLHWRKYCREKEKYRALLWRYVQACDDQVWKHHLTTIQMLTYDGSRQS